MSNTTDRVIPDDLNAQVQTIRAFATTHNLLNGASFPVGHMQIVTDCLAFLKSVHSAAVKAASEHPSAMDVPELKQYLESLKPEASDGATQEG